MARTARAGATLLLPARATFAGQGLPLDVARAIGRADRAQAEPGERPQLLRHFTLLPRAWPVAALTRAVDARDADAGGVHWLRADPAWIRPDINGARLFASGEGLRLAREDADALLPALRPLFGDAGMPIDAPHSSRWYLRVAPGVSLPAFPDPSDALGTDLGDALVEPDAGHGPDARRWRALLTEAQVVLHNHPWNARRAAEGKPPVNSLWFWGGGALPLQVVGPGVLSGDALLQGLALRGGASQGPLPMRFEQPGGDTLFDLREIRDPDALATEWLRPALQSVRDGALAGLRLDFVDGAKFDVAPGQRWRFWRRPQARLA
jgi:hypothetical protein